MKHNNPFMSAPFVPLNRTRSYIALQAMKRKKRNEVLGFIAVCVAFGVLMPLACYVSITAELCKRVESGVYDVQAQEAMKLSPEICAKPWYTRL